MSAPPNILVFLTDQHSPLALGCYGHPIVETPALDRLAADGVRFEQAYCNSPLCVPSRLSFLSGLYPSRIGAWDLLAYPPLERTSIPGYLSAHGYHTAAIGKMHFLGENQRWGFDERPYGDFLGGSHQPDPIHVAPRLPLLPTGPAEIPEAAMQESIVNRLALDFLQTYDRAEPFCLWVSYNRPHFPLAPPRRYWERYYPDNADMPDLGPDFPARLHPWMQHHRAFHGVEGWTAEETRRARAAYYACVSFIDDKVAEIMRALEARGDLENTIVVYFSDHGEMNGEHGLWGKTCFYEPSVRVPWIIRYPRALPRGASVTQPVELVDLYPTLAALAGLPIPHGLDGRSLLPLMTGAAGADEGKGYVISEMYGHSVPGPMRMIRQGDWKYILYLDAQPGLFNLREDPHEFHDRIDDPGTAQRVARDLDHLLRQDWDEAAVRANFRYVGDRASFPSPRKRYCPNQFLLPDGTYRDAEDFYGDTYLRADQALGR